MSQRGTGFILFACIAGLIAACGGSALGDGGLGVAGQSSSGGSSSSAGATASGGGSQAGSSAAGAPSAGAPASDRCSLPAASGTCDAYFPAFYHDAKSGLCRPFAYGGCGGNDNRFETREACLAACAGGGLDWGRCEVDSDCAIASAGCCEACEPVQDHDLLAYDPSQLSVSDSVNPQCASVGACLPCPAESDSLSTRKYFRPICSSGQCSLLDVRLSGFTECKQASDCVLRDGVKCCAECDGGFVSVNANANFCPNGPQACPKCASFPPKDQIASCQMGRCTSEFLL